MAALNRLVIVLMPLEIVPIRVLTLNWKPIRPNRFGSGLMEIGIRSKVRPLLLSFVSIAAGSTMNNSYFTLPSFGRRRLAIYSVNWYYGQ